MSDKTEPWTALQIAVYAINSPNTDKYADEVARLIEEYRQSSPVESPDEFAMKFLEYASGLAVSNYKSGGHWYLSDGRIVKTADILKQFKSELEEPKEK